MAWIGTPEKWKPSEINNSKGDGDQDDGEEKSRRRIEMRWEKGTYSVYRRNENASSVSDANSYIIVSKSLYHIFNVLPLLLRLWGIQTYSSLSVRYSTQGVIQPSSRSVKETRNHGLALEIQQLNRTRFFSRLSHLSSLYRVGYHGHMKIV
jgi:hypothetical protein